MTQYEYYIQFPDGEIREIYHELHIDWLIDIQGDPLPLPLPTHKMIAYCITRQRTSEERGVVSVLYALEQMTADELLAYL